MEPVFSQVPLSSTCPVSSLTERRWIGAARPETQAGQRASGAAGRLPRSYRGSYMGRMRDGLWVGKFDGDSVQTVRETSVERPAQAALPPLKNDRDMSEPIRFYHRHAVREVSGADVTRTVLQYLREDAHCTGTKEGCAEGDCGACTVVVGELTDAGTVAFKAVNACIQFLPTLDGRALLTVEDLRQPDGSLHPVQQAMVDCHGSQCGFCTPGFVMSMWALYEKHGHEGCGSACAKVKDVPTRTEIADALTGNLCRCTGYRPIIDAAVQMFNATGEGTSQPVAPVDTAALARTLASLKRDDTFDYTTSDGARFAAPRTLDALAALKLERPDARILAGSTDIGLWVTKQMRRLDDLIYVGQIAELQTIAHGDDWIEIGAGVTLENAYAALAGTYPELTEMWKRFASLPIRNAGTMGGNVANGSPIGDSMPGLIALGARVVLRGGDTVRELPLEALYTGYQQKDMAPHEFVVGLKVPTRTGAREAAVPHLQGVEAVRLRHLGRVRGVRVRRGRRHDPRTARRVRRDGRDAEACDAYGSRARRRAVARSHRAGRDAGARTRLPATLRHARDEHVSPRCREEPDGPILAGDAPARPAAAASRECA